MLFCFETTDHVFLPIYYSPQVKGEVEKKLGKQFDTFKATLFSTQVVSGVNYFVKVSHSGKFLADYFVEKFFMSCCANHWQSSTTVVQFYFEFQFSE